jgi:hypothetical protein
MDESFGSTSVTVSHDKAGNLIDDGTFEYQYDAYNRLVKVRSSVDADVTYQTANFDGLGRRIKKDVANSGDLDGTTVFYYDGQGIIETRDGSGNLVSQFVRGLRYIDEVVMVRVKDEGELYVHQAEGDQGGSPKDWNVVGLTDLGGRLVERYVYRPYGEVTVHQLGGYADYDGDVDANDRGEITGLTCGGSNPSGACRVLDFDFDNDCDSSDETLFDSLPHTGSLLHAGRPYSQLGQEFGFHALPLNMETGTYQEFYRHYDPRLRRSFGSAPTSPWESSVSVPRWPPSALTDEDANPVHPFSFPKPKVRVWGVLCELNAYDISVQYGQDPPADATRLASRTWGRECGIEITQRGQKTLDFSDTEDILEIERQFNDPDVEEQLDFHQTDQRWGAEMTALASHEMHARDLNIYFVPKLYEIGGDL